MAKDKKNPAVKKNHKVMRMRQELDVIMKDVELMKEKMIDKRPSHFSKRDIINAFFASLILGITFVLKGGFVRTAVAMNSWHILVVVLSTFVILSVEIFFIGYSRVKDKRNRPFGQFWVKRIITIYAISLVTSLYIIYMFGVNSASVNGFVDVVKMTFLLAFPCSVGAAIPSLMKQY